MEGSGEFAAKVAEDKYFIRIKNVKRKMQCKENRKREKIKAIKEERKLSEGTGALLT